MSQTEFIAMMAMLFATVAFSIDSMLPALGAIAAELTPQDPNRAQLILTSFVLGMGVGTFLTGPLSDAFGRKPVLIAGSAVYCAAALAAWFAPNLEMVLAARFLGGIGAAGPRIVSLAVVRDLYKGRDMARIVSFAMTVFALVPAVAPLLGSFIIAGFGWRGIFLAFIGFALIGACWLGFRQPETLPPAARRPLNPRAMARSLAEVLGNRVVVTSIAVQSLVFGVLFAVISTIQPIFEQVYGRGDSFPLWFALIAAIAATGSFVNARLVGRLGMRFLITTTLGAQCLVSVTAAALWLAGVQTGTLAFAVFFVWALAVFFSNGFLLGNLNALAMEPMGHIAGLAASAVGALSTVISVVIAAPVGLAFDGTPLPLIGSAAVMAGLAVLLMRTIPR